MFQKKKLLYIILALVFVSLLVWAFLVYRDRAKEYESSTPESTETQQLNEENTDLQTDEEADDSEITDTTDSEENNLDDEDEENVVEEKTSYDEITAKDCANECKDFKKKFDDLKYCQQICGLTPINEEIKKGTCDSLSGLEKDYCLKDLAVDKEDFKICDEIEDAGIQKTCRNRIAEDILN